MKEGYKHLKRRVQQHLGAAGPQRDLLQRRDRVPDMEVDDGVCLRRRAVDEAVARREQLRVVDVVRHLRTWVVQRGAGA